MKENAIKELVAQLTLKEKAVLCSGANYWNTNGVERLGIPAMMVTDGPNGLRKQQGSMNKLGIYDSVKTTCFPGASALAASFDRGLLERFGKLLGQECQAENVGMILGPGVNIKRSPVGGRNFEYYSEDPLLAGELGAAMIRGLQSQGVSACIKHFAANNQETRRMSSNSVVGERALREIYLTPFEIAVKKSDPWGLMCSYNRLNGVFGAENQRLLTEILRKEWGFHGMVVTDWGAVKDRVKGVAAGLNLEMPGLSDHSEQIVQAVEQGHLAQEQLDRSVETVVRALMRWKENHRPETVYDREEHYVQAAELAKECAVLLKNENQLLPLKQEQKVAFVGAFAKEPRTQGFGSSCIHSYKTGNALDAAAGRNVVYARGYDPDCDEIDPTLINEAVQAAVGADVAVVFAGLPDLYETEGLDRKSMDMPANQVALIEAVAAVNPNTVVVLHNGSAVAMPWLDRAAAVLELYLAGDGIGEATVALLWGESNPCGKLPETFPVRLQDNPSYLNFPGEGDTVVYREGIFVGYRYYDKKELDVTFPFGHGLSYTSFAYGDLRLDRDSIREGECLTASVTVKNTGSRFGKEVVQLYVRNPGAGKIRPVRELREFAKVALQPGESTVVTFELPPRAFTYYDEAEGRFAAESGMYAVEVGSSSRDIRSACQVTVQALPHAPVKATMATCIADLLDRPTGRMLYQKMLEHYAVKPTDSAEKQKSAKRDVRALSLQYPVSTLTMFSNMKEEEIYRCLEQINQEQPDQFGAAQ